MLRSDPPIRSIIPRSVLLKTLILWDMRLDNKIAEKIKIRGIKKIKLYKVKRRLAESLNFS